MRAQMAVAATAAALILAACGGSSGSSSTPPSTTASPPSAAGFVIGSWHGELHQQGMPPFRVSVTVASLSNSASNPVHYTGLNCSGHWTYLGTTAETARFREVIASGKSAKCKGVGEVTLTRTGTRLRYRFTGGGVVSLGVLSRG
jgi:hypothetical protein